MDGWLYVEAYVGEERYRIQLSGLTVCYMPAHVHSSCGGPRSAAAAASARPAAHAACAKQRCCPPLPPPPPPERNSFTHSSAHTTYRLELGAPLLAAHAAPAAGTAMVLQQTPADLRAEEGVTGAREGMGVAAPEGAPARPAPAPHPSPAVARNAAQMFGNIVTPIGTSQVPESWAGTSHYLRVTTDHLLSQGYPREVRLAGHTHRLNVCGGWHHGPNRGYGRRPSLAFRSLSVVPWIPGGITLAPPTVVVPGLVKISYELSSGFVAPARAAWG